MLYDKSRERHSQVITESFLAYFEREGLAVVSVTFNMVFREIDA